MFNYFFYKKIKDRLKTIASVFYYLGQYNKGKDNTSYIVPAIYIEMPPVHKILFWRSKKSSKCEIRIHYISNAPFKNHDTPVQDSALSAHDNVLNTITDLLQGWVIKEGTALLSQSFIADETVEMKMIGANVVSILTFRTELMKQ